MNSTRISERVSTISNTPMPWPPARGKGRRKAGQVRGGGILAGARAPGMPWAKIQQTSLVPSSASPLILAKRLMPVPNSVLRALRQRPRRSRRSAAASLAACRPCDPVSGSPPAPAPPAIPAARSALVSLAAVSGMADSPSDEGLGRGAGACCGGAAGGGPSACGAPSLPPPLGRAVPLVDPASICDCKASASCSERELELRSCCGKLRRGVETAGTTSIGQQLPVAGDPRSRKRYLAPEIARLARQGSCLGKLPQPFFVLHSCHNGVAAYSTAMHQLLLPVQNSILPSLACKQDRQRDGRRGAGTTTVSVTARSSDVIASTWCIQLSSCRSAGFHVCLQA